MDKNIYNSLFTSLLYLLKYFFINLWLYSPVGHRSLTADQSSVAGHQNFFVFLSFCFFFFFIFQQIWLDPFGSGHQCPCQSPVSSLHSPTSANHRSPMSANHWSSMSTIHWSLKLAGHRWLVSDADRSSVAGLQHQPIVSCQSSAPVNHWSPKRFC